jgi:hypothetical protein
VAGSKVVESYIRARQLPPVELLQDPVAAKCHRMSSRRTNTRPPQAENPWQEKRPSRVALAFSAHHLVALSTLQKCPATLPDNAALFEAPGLQDGHRSIAHAIYHPSLPCGRHAVIWWTSPPRGRTARLFQFHNTVSGPRSGFVRVYEIAPTRWIRSSFSAPSSMCHLAASVSISRC